MFGIRYFEFGNKIVALETKVNGLYEWQCPNEVNVSYFVHSMYKKSVKVRSNGKVQKQKIVKPSIFSLSIRLDEKLVFYRY